MIGKILKDHKTEVIIVVVGILYIHLFLFFKPFTGNTYEIDINKARDFGSFIGGYLGTILLLISLVLLFSTLKNQIKIFLIQQFENKYFEMIRLHRENVNEISIGNRKGRKIFLSLVREFQIVFSETQRISELLKLKYENKKLLDISYIIFFYGVVGSTSTEILKTTLTNEPKKFIKELIYFFGKSQSSIKSSHKFQYKPFEGHQSRLGHYYRHLYQTVKYVHLQKLNINKYDYLKTLRAQLSNHEQVLLCYNAFSRLGENWLKENLISEYNFIKNIPPNFITEIDFKKEFPLVKFEWEENK
jgi:hypothetical protein